MADAAAGLHIVRDFKVGNTRIRIADDYCRDKTPEEVKEILRRISINAQAAFTAAANKDKE